MSHRYATGLALSDSPVDALCMENMAASESNAGLLAKFINVAQAAHVWLSAIDKRALFWKAWLRHIHHVLRLYLLFWLLAWGIHAGEALSLALDPAASVPTRNDLPTKLILFPILAQAWNHLSHWLLGCSLSIVTPCCWHPMSSQVVNRVTDDDLVVDHSYPFIWSSSLY